MAIQKRRALFAKKERDYRQELLQTGFIQSLCKHLGERRARRRKRGVKRTDNVLTNDKKCENNQEVPVALVEPVLQSSEPSAKRSRMCCSDEDPFGLDKFFEDLLHQKTRQSEFAFYSFFFNFAFGFYYALYLNLFRHQGMSSNCDHLS